MRETYGNVRQSEELGPLPGSAVKVNMRLALIIRQDLNLLPGDPPQARSQGLGNGLFGSEAGRQLRSPTATKCHFLGCKNAVQEALAPAGERFGHTRYLNDIYSYALHNCIIAPGADLA